MGIFGGEKYSKEGYEKAEQELKDALEIINQTPRGRGEYKNTPVYGPGGRIETESVFIETPAGKHERKAHQKLYELHASGQKEANALKVEYDRLLVEAQEAVKAVADFEREKLGMHKEGAEEADTDKK